MLKVLKLGLHFLQSINSYSRYGYSKTFELNANQIEIESNDGKDVVTYGWLVWLVSHIRFDAYWLVSCIESFTVQWNSRIFLENSYLIQFGSKCEQYYIHSLYAFISIFLIWTDFLFLKFYNTFTYYFIS